MVRYVKQLRTLNDRFAALLAKDKPADINPATVRAAAAAGQERLLQAVAMILGRHPTSAAADVQARQDLLGPILEQNEAIGAYLRAHRAVRDVDADTGQEQPEEPAGPAEPAVGPVTGGEGGGGAAPAGDEPRA